VREIRGQVEKTEHAGIGGAVRQEVAE
jgi:hypothetical protein